MNLCACGCGTQVRRHFAHGHNRRSSVVDHPSTPAVDRVLARTVHEDRGHGSLCWCWKGAVRDGYGQVGTYSDGRLKNCRTHRIVYEALVGPIPDGLCLDHLCEVKECVNPAHLEPVTLGENNRRHSERHFAGRTHCRHGHSLAEHRYVSPNGYSQCRLCNKAACDRYEAKKSLHKLLCAS